MLTQIITMAVRHVISWSASYIRGFLYFSIGYLGAYLPKAENFKTWQDLTDFQYLHIHLASLLVGLVSVRAFLDGSVERNAQKIAAGNGQQPQ